MAKLFLTPELLSMVGLLPCRVVGSCESEGCACLRVDVEGYGHDDIVTALVERNGKADPWTRITLIRA